VGRPQFFTIDRTHQLAQGLVFAGLGNAPGSVRYHDSSGRGNYGTLTNMEPETDWGCDSWLGRRFTIHDGSYERAQIAVLAGGPPKTVSIKSLVCWIKPTSFSNLRYFFCQGMLLSSANWGWGCGIDTSGNLAVTSSITPVSSTTAVTLNQWNCVCLQQITNNTCVAWNAGASSNISTTGFSSTYLTDPDGAVGCVMYNTSAMHSFYGSISDVLYYDRILSPSEIALLANPSNFMLSGMIRPIGSESNIYDREGIR